MRARSILVGLAIGLLTLWATGPGEAEARGKKRAHKARKLGKHGRGGHAPNIAAIRDGKPNIQAASAVVVDLKTGEILFSKDPDTVRPIASISKLMASLVLVEKGLDLKGTQTITNDDKKVAFKGPIGKLFEGYQFKNEDLLHAALIASDNRALPALARTLGMNAQQFSAAMTERAKGLGLPNTRFEDPTGLNDGNVSTAREVVQMLRAALANTTIRPILQKKQYEVRALNKPRVITYNNTDRLIGSNTHHILGGKTGYTDLARYCLTIAAKIGEREVAMAFLHAEGKMTRFADFNRVAFWLEHDGPALAKAAEAKSSDSTKAGEPKPASDPSVRPTFFRG